MLDVESAFPLIHCFLPYISAFFFFFFPRPGFKRKEFRGKLAIAITANFINRNTTAEAKVEEISGVAFIFNQKFFLDLKEETGGRAAPQQEWFLFSPLCLQSCATDEQICRIMAI